MARSASFRLRLTLLVLVVALAPLAIVGLWLGGAAARSGERLLRERLSVMLESTAASIVERWAGLRQGMLAIAELDVTQQTLSSSLAPGTAVPSEVQTIFGDADAALTDLVIRDASARPVWRLERPLTADRARVGGVAAIQVTVEIRERVSGRRLGSVEAHVLGFALVGERADLIAPGGMSIVITDPATGTVLTPTPFDPGQLSARRFRWTGDDWIAEHRNVADPRLALIAAGPLSPFVQPFEDAARRGLALLLVTGAAGLVAALVLTTRVTRRLRDLATDADTVAAGDLARKARVAGGDELERLAVAFNSMTENLAITVQQLASRESMATLGQLSAELVHEIRNPLTSIRVDLQYVEERLDRYPALREAQRGALEEIGRLDGIVTGMLQLARGGVPSIARIDLRDPLCAALRTAQPAFDARSLTIDAELPDAPVMIDGDGESLRQVTLNLLLNAAQAVDGGGAVRVKLGRRGADVSIEIADDGVGMAPEILAKVRQPFFTTRSQGTGLGLALVDRVVRAHHGTLEIESREGGGTRVCVTLPARRGS